MLLPLPMVILFTYPIFSFFSAKLFPKRVFRSESFVPPFSMVIACFNEEKYIGNKISSLLEKEFWPEGSEIILVTGGSTDKTSSIVSSYMGHSIVKPVVEQRRLTKIEGVNLAVKLAKNEILVFSDCRQILKKGSIAKLNSNFNDESVGTVAGVLQDPDNQKKSSWFRDVLNNISRWDSAYGSCLNVHGAFYAQRRKIFKEFPVVLLFDDLYVVASTLAQGFRLIQEPNAIIYDVSFNLYYKSERIERLTRGLLIFLTTQWKLILKMPVGDRIRFLIFKYLKLFLPFCFFVVFPAFLWFAYFELEATLLFYCIAGLLPILIVKRARSVISVFLKVNAFFFIAIFKFAFMGKRSNQWQKLDETPTVVQ